MDELRGEMNRKSKDKIIGNGGRKLVNLINDIGRYLINGNVKENKERAYIYIGVRGCIVIDYVILNEMCNKVGSFKVDNRIDSDHLPLILAVRDEGEIASSNIEKDYKKNMVERTIIR